VSALIDWWRRYFIWAEFGLAVAITAAFLIWMLEWHGSDVVAALLKGRRVAIYGVLASVFGALLGFIITTVSVVIVAAQSQRLDALRESKHYRDLWRIFFATIRGLALATAVSFLSMLFDQENAPSDVWVAACFYVIVLATLRLARSVVVLQFVVKATA